MSRVFVKTSPAYAGDVFTETRTILFVPYFMFLFLLNTCFFHFWSCHRSWHCGRSMERGPKKRQNVIRGKTALVQTHRGAVLKRAVRKRVVWRRMGSGGRWRERTTTHNTKHTHTTHNTHNTQHTTHNTHTHTQHTHTTHTTIGQQRIGQQRIGQKRIGQNGLAKVGHYRTYKHDTHNLSWQITDMVNMTNQRN